MQEKTNEPLDRVADPHWRCPGHRFRVGIRSLALSGMALLMPAFGMADLGAQAAEDFPTAHGTANRPVVTGRHGMVASNHPLASAAGIEVMMKGGTAFDAAIATGAALGVVEPFMSGLGGVGWMLIHEAATGQTHVLNFSGRSPAALTAELFGDRIESRGALASLVPGSAAAWEALSERFGTMAPADLLAPAIRLAEDGYPLTAFGAGNHAQMDSLFQAWDGLGARTWWGGAATPPAAGTLIRNPNLARTYRTLASQGFSAFYQGDIAREIASTYQRYGGVLSEADMAGYEISWEAPIRITYRGHEILSTAPNSSGGLAILQTLNMVEGYDLQAMGVNSAEYIHVLTEAIKLAAMDRARWSGDPDFMDQPIPLDRLLSKEYAAELRASIDMRQAGSGQLGESQVGTTHYTVADGAGNIISVTTTMGGGFGSALVGGETGVALNNGINWFELDPNSPAFVEGGKRTRWNMGPTMVLRDGAPLVAMGTPGGTTIWQTQPQLITKLIDFGMDVQTAIESPRFRWELGGTTLRPEGRISADVMDQLRSMGHDVQPLAPWTMAVGGMNAIMIDRATGYFFGGADPRRDGYVIAW